MVDCSCYHDEVNFIGKRGVCWGTKEMEPCSCGGDASKCDFYDYVRERAKKPLTNYDLLIRRSPEELAVQLALPYLTSPPWCSEHITCPYISEDPTPCDKCALEWLKMEVSDGRN